jgi:TetR/AcrR family transcriptional regulator, transcriptional repressor for nem operon
MGQIGDKTRQRILEATAPLLNKHGFAGLSMSEVMGATGLEKGGIYRHFASKDELAAATLAHSYELVQKARAHGVDEQPTPLARLHRLLTNFDTEPGAILPGGCPYVNSAVDADDTSPLRLAQVRRAFDEWHGRIAQIVCQAVDAGELRRSTNPEAIATLILATIEGAVVLSRAQQSRAPIQLCLRHLAEHLDSLRPTTGTEDAA